VVLAIRGEIVGEAGRGDGTVEARAEMANVGRDTRGEGDCDGEEKRGPCRGEAAGSERE
jgi:hypothetical protein